MTMLSPVFSKFILLFFPWFRPFDGRYLQSKACIIIERSDLNRICALRMIYLPHQDMLLEVDGVPCRRMILIAEQWQWAKKVGWKEGEGRGPARGGKNLS